MNVYLERITRFILGPLFVLGGLWFIVLPFVFATLGFGDRDDAPPSWGEYLGEVFEGGTTAIAIGLALVTIGLLWASGWPYSSTEKADLKRTSEDDLS